jgi:hypothetical protein
VFSPANDANPDWVVTYQRSVMRVSPLRLGIAAGVAVLFMLGSAGVAVAGDEPGTPSPTPVPTGIATTPVVTVTEAPRDLPDHRSTLIHMDNQTNCYLNLRSGAAVQTWSPLPPKQMNWHGGTFGSSSDGLTSITEGETVWNVSCPNYAIDTCDETTPDDIWVDCGDLVIHWRNAYGEKNSYVLKPPPNGPTKLVLANGDGVQAEPTVTLLWL